VAIAPGGALLACSTSNEDETVHTIQLWDVKTVARTAAIPIDNSASRVVFSPDGRTLYACCADKSISRWDVASGQALPSFHGHQNGVSALAVSPDGELLASGSSGRRIRLWDVRTGRQVALLVGHADSVDALAFTPDGKTLASGCSDGSVKLWSVATGLELLSLDMPPSAPGIVCLAFSHDGDYLAAGCHALRNASELQIWSARRLPEQDGK
jgi:WD40 repeat protein